MFVVEGQSTITGPSKGTELQNLVGTSIKDQFNSKLPYIIKIVG